jgi:hypothetical protein
VGDLRGHHDATHMCQGKLRVSWDLRRFMNKKHETVGVRQRSGEEGSNSCRGLDADGGLEGRPHGGRGCSGAGVGPSRSPHHRLGRRTCAAATRERRWWRPPFHFLEGEAARLPHRAGGSRVNTSGSRGLGGFRRRWRGRR